MPAARANAASFGLLASDQSTGPVTRKRASNWTAPHLSNTVTSPKSQLMRKSMTPAGGQETKNSSTSNFKQKQSVREMKDGHAQMASQAVITTFNGLQRPVATKHDMARVFFVKE